MSELSKGEAVWVTDLRCYAEVVEKLKVPRTYLAQTDNGLYRRNRWHLIPAPYAQPSQFLSDQAATFLPEICNNSCRK